jgi:ectoine hydroxylase-related dioxygenase (phytanoyl-CoA dioxygenase family)
VTEVLDGAALLPRVAADTPPNEIAGLLADHGAVLVEALFDAGVIAAVNAEVDGAVADADLGMKMYQPILDDFHGDRTRHVSGLAGKSRTFATEVMAHPLYRSLCDHFLTWSSLGERLNTALPTCGWQLNLAHLIVRGPGSEDQYLHRDEDIWMDAPYPRPGVFQLASMIAFVDFSRENGATRVAPGSHRWPDAQTHPARRTRQPEEQELVYAEMAAGSAVIYLGTTVHGGSANTTTDVWRRGGHLSFALGWLRTEENNVLAVPPAVARTLPRECQEIIGYGSSGFLGAVNMRNPLDLLESGEL